MYRNPLGRQVMFLATLVVAFLSHGTQAQQVAAAQEVPNNFAMHPPPIQPVPYSHKTHLALGLVCEACHINAEQNVHMGFPEISTCMRCHNSIATNQPGVAELTRISASGGQIPWVRVYQVLSGVTWAHQPHVEAGVQCEACHGDVAQLEIMAMTTSVTSMASCINCHQAHEANITCQTCHAWPTE